MCTYDNTRRPVSDVPWTVVVNAICQDESLFVLGLNDPQSMYNQRLTDNLCTRARKDNKTRRRRNELQVPKKHACISTTSIDPQCMISHNLTLLAPESFWVASSVVIHRQ